MAAHLSSGAFTRSRRLERVYALTLHVAAPPCRFWCERGFKMYTVVCRVHTESGRRVPGVKRLERYIERYVVYTLTFYSV